MAADSSTGDPSTGDRRTGDRSTAELERFLAARADHLLHTAALISGSKEAGEDLLQTAVERLLPRWRRFDGDPEAYLRRTIYNLAMDGYRRADRWRQKEALLRSQVQHSYDATGDLDLRDALVRLLMQLPVRQRAVLVLRYWEQLTDAESAVILGWPEGTVKSTAYRALTRMRELADNWNDSANYDSASYDTASSNSSASWNGHRTRGQPS